MQSCKCPSQFTQSYTHPSDTFHRLGPGFLSQCQVNLVSGYLVSSLTQLSGSLHSLLQAYTNHLHLTKSSLTSSQSVHYYGRQSPIISFTVAPSKSMSHNLFHSHFSCPVNKKLFWLTSNHPIMQFVNNPLHVINYRNTKCFV